MRDIRSQLPDLMPDLEQSDLDAMRLGVAHSLSRYKLKFSADKVDTMIVQAINLLDELDKEINTFAMRVKVSLKYSFKYSSQYLTHTNRNGTDGTSQRCKRLSTGPWSTPKWSSLQETVRT